MPYRRLPTTYIPRIKQQLPGYIFRHLKRQVHQHVLLSSPLIPFLRFEVSTAMIMKNAVF
jgi:hypothetical protein